MKKQLYLDIKNCIKSIKDESGRPLFQHFDLWNEQSDLLEEDAPFACPAVFVEFGDMSWRQKGHAVQDCDLTVRLHIITEWYAETADSSPTESQALDYLDLSDKVIAAMHNFRTENTNGFVRTKTIVSHNRQRYVDSIEEYGCCLCDTSAAKKTTMVSVTPVIELD